MARIPSSSSPQRLSIGPNVPTGTICEDYLLWPDSCCLHELEIWRAFLLCRTVTSSSQELNYQPGRVSKETRFDSRGFIEPFFAF
jgi:hypothetical protein